MPTTRASLWSGVSDDPAAVAENARFGVNVTEPLLATGLFLLPGCAPEPSRLLGGAVLAVTAAVAGTALTMLDARRNNELLLFANLGVHPAVVVCTASAAPVALEFVLALARYYRY